MRTKSVILSFLLCLFYTAAFTQRENTNTFSNGPENYQTVFFNPFSYDDFSYRFSSLTNNTNQSFGKRIYTPLSALFSLKDSVLLDSLKAVSNIYLVLGSRKNQALQLENLQRIGKSTFLYLNYNSVASLGFVKNSASRNRCFDFQVSHNSKNYNLDAGFLFVSNYDGSPGGISDSVVSSNYSKRDLLQLDVNLNNDYLRKRFFNVDLKHQFNLYSSLNGEKDISFSLQNNYSRFGFLYAGDGFNPFYNNVFYDSSATNDTCGYSWLKNEMGLTTKLNFWKFNVNVVNEDFNLQMMDSLYHFNDWSVKSSFSFNRNNFNFYGSFSKNVGNYFRQNNQEAKIGLLYQLNHHFIRSIELISNYSLLNVPFVYQKQFSNHYYWDLLNNNAIEQFRHLVNVKMKNNFLLNASATSYKNRVYLNEKINPEVSNLKESIFSLQLSYNDTIGKLHLIEIASYNYSNSSFFPVIPIQSFTRIGYMFSLFKNNLKVEAGVSGIYNNSWYATSYSPALDDFYLQSEKKFGGLAVLNVFADFKIKSATLFLKVERVNIGWFKENSFIRDGYIAPPRTIRFGFNWPLTN